MTKSTGVGRGKGGGGAQPNSGRKRKPRPEIAAEIIRVARGDGPATELLPEAYAALKRVAANVDAPSASVMAAKTIIALAERERAAAKFEATPLGKKEETMATAHERATGKFAPPPPPLSGRMN